MKSPKALFHENSDHVKWLANVIDDPRFEMTLMLVEMQIHSRLSGINGPNQMMIDNAIRIGAHRFRQELIAFASKGTKPVEWEMPSVLHAPDRPVEIR